LVPLLRQSNAKMPILVFTAQETGPLETAGADLVLIKSRASLDLLVEATMTRIGETKAQVK
jgi:hypothetical protein